MRGRGSQDGFGPHVPVMLSRWQDQPSARRIVSALRGTYTQRSRQGMCRCPAHNDKTPSLHVTQAADTVLLKCFAGCDQLSVIAALRERGLWPERQEQGSPSAPMKKPEPRNDAPIADDGEVARMAAARAIWEGARPVAGTLGARYLAYRGVDSYLPPTLRFSPSLKHGPTGQILPALIGAIQDGLGKVLAVQRIYLRPDGLGKAGVEPAKMVLGPMRDGAVRLGKPARVLGIAEGIETGLSAQRIFALPVWVSLGAARLGSLTIPDHIEHLVIFADLGEPGMAAAANAAEKYRALGIHVDIEAPDSGKDWNDELTQECAA